METARREGDQFLSKYFTERRVVTSTIPGELTQIAADAGITWQPTTWTRDPCEGSDARGDDGRSTPDAGGPPPRSPSSSTWWTMIARRFLIIEKGMVGRSPADRARFLNVTVRVRTS